MHVASRWLTVLVGLLFAFPCLADPGGTLTGAVRTIDGAPLAQVVLTVSGASGTRTVVTGSDGRYRVAGLSAGEYELALETTGSRDTSTSRAGSPAQPGPACSAMTAQSMPGAWKR